MREQTRPAGWRGVAESYVFSATSLVIVPCERVSQRVAEAGVTAERIAVVPNAVATEEADQSLAKARLREHLSLAPDAPGPILGAVGRWDDPQRCKEIAWAADLVRVLHPGVCLAIAGEGSGNDSCRRFAMDATAPGVVRMLGHESQWAELLPGFDALWCPSASSTAPTPLLEAMAAGAPIVAAKSDGREALVRDGETGWLTGWNDRAGWTKATDRLLADPELAGRVATSASNEVRELRSPERVAEEHRAALVG